VLTCGEREFGAMSRIKMKDVALAAGVSAMTVSRALKQDGRIAPETRRQILAVVQRLGYVPDRLAGSFSSQRSGFIAVLVPSINNPHFAETASGLQDVLQPAGLQMLLGYTDYNTVLAERLIETMLERRPEAIVVTYDDHTPRARQLLRAAAIPVIEIWETPRKPIGHVVGFSNRRASAAMTREVIARGRRKLAYIGESQDVGTRGAERRKGFLDAMKAARLASHRQLNLAAPPITMLQGRNAMDEVLRRWPECDAVICVSDPCAFGALSACQLAGVAVPGDMAIAGFGDFEISRCAVPAISTVAVCGLEIGARTGELVLQVLRGKKALPPQVILVEAVPQMRASSIG
jgi:LacI family transcriptional regulator, gluconate utilization system Gnt-I transcriptional repressor